VPQAPVAVRRGGKNVSDNSKNRGTYVVYGRNPFEYNWTV